MKGAAVMALSIEDLQRRTSPADQGRIAEAELWPDQATTSLRIGPPVRLWSTPLAVTVLGMIVGTGGTQSLAAVICPSGSNPTYQWRTVKRGPVPTSQVDVRERLGGLKRYLSLNVSDLARVVGVERPTIYAWLDDRSEPHRSNLRKVDQVYRLAQAWRSMSSVPIGKYLRESLADSPPLLELLTSAELDEYAIRYAFSQIKAMIDRQSAARREQQPSVTEMARRHGFPEISKEMQQRSFDAETGL